MDTIRFLRCLIFHRKHRKRTGERDIYRMMIYYYLKCEKCGSEDREVIWFI